MNSERILCFPQYLIKITACRVDEDSNGCQRRGGGGGKEEEQENPTVIRVCVTFIERSVTKICQKYSEITCTGYVKRRLPADTIDQF
jgi:hypothetical protein